MNQSETTYLQALLHGKCPRCRNGTMFAFPLRRISKFNVMNATCPYCGVMLQPEPGFYQGAMYVQYAFTIAVIVIVSIILYLSGNPSEWTYIGTIITIMILIVPINYRYSRIIYLYLFGGIKYKPE